MQIPEVANSEKALKLLVVDDDEEDLFFLKRLLHKGGREHSIIVATNVDQALEMLELMPDVILLDYCLGDRTGFDLLQLMEKSGCSLPVIMLTGFDNEELDDLAYSSGVADFLPKRQVNPVILDRSIRYAYRDFTRVQQLEYLAHYDTLTGLCNRRLFMDRLEHAFEGCKRHHTSGALLYIDIDEFKHVNDELGHATGDELLKAVADRMRHSVRSADTVARLGGDEFVILLEQVSAAEAHWVAQKLLYAMEAPIELQHHTIECALSIGLCVFSGQSISPHEILTSADRALYQAKLTGKHTYCSYNQSLMETLSRKSLIETMAQQTIITGEFELYYQPRYDNLGGRILSFEALARWPRREGVQLTPEDFIPVIESLGLMDRFTCLVIDRAIRDLPALQKFAPGCHLSINVSPSNFDRMNWQSCLLDRLFDRKIDPTQIEIEVTENTFINQAEAAITTLSMLRTHGIRVALDDFGTGYSSLSCLNQLPIDTIKLDRNFLERVPDCERSSLLVKAIVELACQLQLNVVAEGVENFTQMDFLQRCGCHELQGFLTGRPMSVEQLQEYFSRQPT